MAILTDRIDENEPGLRNAIESILALVRRQPELRFFVDGTPNCGHQSATVNLMRRLIELTSYSGTITVVYADIHEGSLGRTPEKLALLFSHLDPTVIDYTTISYESCENIRFVSYDRRKELTDGVLLGFTGAADDMRINFATQLKVKYFLRLQPYLWDDDPSRLFDRFYVTSRIETMDDQYFCPVEAYPPFRCIPCKPPRVVELDELFWDWYGSRQTFNAQLRTRTRNAQAVYEVCSAVPTLRILPIYGLHHFRDQLAEIALNLCLSILAAQTYTPGPIIVLLLNSTGDITSFWDLVMPLTADLNRTREFTQFHAALTVQFRQHFADGSFSEEAVRDFLREFATYVRSCLNQNSRVIVQRTYEATTGEYIDISERLRRILLDARDHELILLELGPVPGDLYTHFYTHCGMPGIFEGACSASASIALGRPYLQLSRHPGSAPSPYLTIGDYHLAEVATRANKASLALRDRHCSTYLHTNRDAEPSSYFEGLEEITTFICHSLDHKSELSRYFDAIGSHFNADIRDKSLLGLMALTLSMDLEGGA